jgi:hypothetical protein
VTSAVLERLRPDVWVKGGDYSGGDLPEAPVVRRQGGEVVLLPYTDRPAFHQPDRGRRRYAGRADGKAAADWHPACHAVSAKRRSR